MDIELERAYIVVYWDCKSESVPVATIRKIFYSYPPARKYYLETVEYLKDKVRYGSEWLYVFKVPLTWVDENNWEDLIGKPSKDLALFIQTKIRQIDIMDSTILGEYKSEED